MASNNNVEGIIIPKTLSQSIYEHLKNSILRNELKSNERINKKEIAELFQVSLTPVREAIVKLAAEGFVEDISHREVLVKEVSYKEWQEICQVIKVLDKLAAALLGDQIEPPELTKLIKITNRMERAYIMSEVDKFIELNYDFHKRLWNNLKNKNEFLHTKLKSCLNQIKMCDYPLRNALKNPKIMKTAVIFHKEIIEALKNKDKQKLEKLIAEHWNPILP